MTDAERSAVSDFVRWACRQPRSGLEAVEVDFGLYQMIEERLEEQADNLGSARVEAGGVRVCGIPVEWSPELDAIRPPSWRTDEVVLAPLWGGLIAAAGWIHYLLDKMDAPA